MKRARFSKEQVVAMLREQEAGVVMADACRKHGISQATFFKWKAKFGGMNVSDVRRLKVLEDENAKLKRLLAEAMPDNTMLKGVAKKMVIPVARREAAANPCQMHGVSQRRARRVIGADRTLIIDPLPWPAA
ncbi:MAG TPA: transposase [Magnetospirillaceae bacterium]|jgi:putative transposase